MLYFSYGLLMCPEDKIYNISVKKIKEVDLERVNTL